MSVIPDPGLLAALRRSNRRELRRLPVGSSIEYSIHPGVTGEDLLALGRYAGHDGLGPALHLGTVRKDSAEDTVQGDRWAGVRRPGALTVFSGLVWRTTAARLVSGFTECHIHHVSSAPCPGREGA
ncbi:hypothetical protein ACIQUL_30035 [Streptomyces sp. NPDC090303]|uniref:hypothetical protein n=1 Tax=Streptomyces sp. NPDC090303 TaxID=3365960 RepID=UPI00381A63F5